MESIKKVSYIFTRKQKIQFIILLFITLVGGFVEMLSVSAILPLVDVITDEKIIFEHEIYSFIYHFLGLNSAREFTLVMAISLVVIYILKNLYVIFMNDVQFRFIYSSQKKLAYNLFEVYMNQDYVFHLANNSATLQSNILQDVSMFNSTISNFLMLLTELIVCLFLMSFLLIVDVSTTSAVGVLVIVFTSVFYWFYKKSLVKWGNIYRQLNALNIKWLQQSFGGIKEIKILNREEFFVSIFRRQYDKNIKAVHIQKMLGLIPRPLMETLCIGGLLIIMALKIYNGVDPMTFIPTLSVFVIAAFRMLPSFNRITSYLSVIMFNKAGINAVYDEMKRVSGFEEKKEIALYEANKDLTEIIYENEIELKDITFKYPDTEKNVLSGIDLTIPKNSSVAFIGSSGSGKTTLVDIILGVLKPDQGEVLIDNVSIHSALGAWYKKIGYIPQNIYLIDDTIRNNIAFGLRIEQIEDEKVWRALREAQLEEYVKSLPEGLDTVIGEKGVRLSGGQRQRIGIARTLYNEPEVLVMDEATSALDNETESAFMESLNELKGKKTLIIVAHRLTTIINCDKIYSMNQGKLELISREEVLEEINKQSSKEK